MVALKGRERSAGLRNVLASADDAPFLQPHVRRSLPEAAQSRRRGCKSGWWSCGECRQLQLILQPSGPISSRRLPDCNALTACGEACAACSEGRSALRGFPLRYACDGLDLLAAGCEIDLRGKSNRSSTKRNPGDAEALESQSKAPVPEALHNCRRTAWSIIALSAGERGFISLRRRRKLPSSLRQQGPQK